MSYWKELGENIKYWFTFLLVFSNWANFPSTSGFTLNASDIAKKGRVCYLQSGGHSTGLSGGRVHSPGSRDSCFSQPSKLLGTEIPQDDNWAFGVYLGPLGTGMLAKIAQAIKIPE